MGYTFKFCPCNFEADQRKVKDKLKEFDNVEIIDGKCLNYCGQCLVQPFVLFNGKNIVCDTADELLVKIKEKMEESDYKEKVEATL